jgi:hypothetical protein
MSIPHLPALRKGKPYDSLEKNEVKDYKTGEVKAEVSQVNAGIVRKDLAKIGEARESLKKFKVSELIEISAKAGDLFLNGTLPLGDRGHTQSPEEYIATLSQTSGLPHVMVKRNMAKLHFALTHMEMILNGLSRGLDMSVIDNGFGEQAGCPVSYFPFGFYPTDHEGSGEVVKLSGRSLVFGDVGTVKQYENNPAVQVHGPGWSKIIIGEDQIENWREHLDVMVASISDNGGRSCINASAVIVPKYGREIAEALAERLGPFEPMPSDDENAKLSGFANAKMAEYIDGAIDADLKVPGAEDVTAKYRNGPRKVEFEGGTFLKATIVRCDSFDHPLANREFLCPYASVVECPQKDVLSKIGYSLIVTAITKDPVFSEALLECGDIDRLNLGPLSTMKISWDQPHEGNMFEFLYKRRSIDRSWN